MDPVIQKAYQIGLQGEKYALATIIATTVRGTSRKAGAKMLVTRQGLLSGTIGGGTHENTVIRECQKAIQTQNPRLLTCENFGKAGQPVCGGKFSVFIDPFVGSQQLVICGAGHIGLALSILGKMLNFDVTVLDSRKDFANRERFAHVDNLLLGNPAVQLKKLPLGENCFIVIVTPSHVSDFACLKAALGSSAVYIGVIGSQTKHLKFRHQLGKQYANRFRMPIGIDIGAQTPEEIAVSIMAEIISCYNKRNQGAKKFSSG